MSEKLAITLDSLKVGCKLLGIKAPRDATSSDLKKLINRELSKDKTMGVYACGACFSDIKIGLSHCPFCGGQFVPTPEALPDIDDDVEEKEEAEDQDFEKAKDEFEDEDEPAEDEPEEEPEEEEEAEEPEESEELDEEEEEELPKPKKKKAKVIEEDEEAEEEIEDLENPMEPDEDDDIDEEESEDEGDDWEGPEDDEDDDEDEPADDDQDEEDEEDELPKPKKFSKAELGKRLNKTVTQDRKEKAVEKLKEQEREQKREQIRSELPYNKVTLEHMKQSTLIMICSILGHKKPVQELKTPEKLIKYILKAQQSWKKLPAKPLLKKAKVVEEKKQSAKATSKPAIKSKSRR